MAQVNVIAHERDENFANVAAMSVPPPNASVFLGGVDISDAATIRA